MSNSSKQSAQVPRSPQLRIQVATAITRLIICKTSSMDNKAIRSPMACQARIWLHPCFRNQAILYNKLSLTTWAAYLTHYKACLRTKTQAPTYPLLLRCLRVNLRTKASQMPRYSSCNLFWPRLIHILKRRIWNRKLYRQRNRIISCKWKVRISFKIDYKCYCL